MASNSPALVDVDASQEELYDDINLEEFSSQPMANVHSQEEDDKENVTFPPSQGGQPQTNQHVQRTQHSQHDSQNSQRYYSPHRLPNEDLSSVKAVSEPSALRADSYNDVHVQPPPSPSPSIKGIKKAAAPTRPSRNTSEVNNKRKLAVAEFEDRVFNGMNAMSPEEDNLADFDPTADIVPFDVLKLPNEQWNALQKEQVDKITSFSKNYVLNAMLMSIEVTQFFSTTNEETRQHLLKAVAQIEAEQEKHKRAVEGFRRFKQLLADGMKELDYAKS